MDSTFFKDHAVVSAALSSLGAPPKMPMWKQPAPVDWSQVPDLQSVEVQIDLDGTTSNQYRLVMSEFEDSIHETLTNKRKHGLHPRQKGRAAITEVQWVSEFSRPLKKARDGEFAPSFHGIDS